MDRNQHVKVNDESPREKGRTGFFQYLSQGGKTAVCSDRPAKVHVRDVEGEERTEKIGGVQGLNLWYAPLENLEKVEKRV